MEKEQNGKKMRISITAPKTEKSWREILLPGFLIEKLGKIRSEKHRNRDYYILTGRHGLWNPGLTPIISENCVRTLVLCTATTICSATPLRQTASRRGLT